MQASDEVLLHEYDAHQARFRQLAQHAAQLQHYALIFSGALWAWALSFGNPTMSKFVLWLPIVLTLLFLTKGIFLHIAAGILFKRLGEIEALLELEDGWYRKSRHLTFRYWVWIFWSLILLVNFLASWWGYTNFDEISGGAGRSAP